jgi:hypothetical protein
MSGSRRKSPEFKLMLLLKTCTGAVADALVQLECICQDVRAKRARERVCL